MSSNKTTQLQLHSWEASDKVLRSEFNENFKKIDSAIAAINNESKVRIVAGSFMGNGSYGSGSPRRLTFTFTPILVVITRDGNSNDFNSQIMFIIHCEKYGSSGSVSWDTDRVTWYSTEGASAQMNETGVLYHYFAIGL